MSYDRPVCIVGPTASGKSALAVRIALELDGEVVSADSMQVYRGMDIGTAKPDIEERRGIPHHMIDVADVSEDWSVGRYTQEASKAIDDIFARGRLPVIAGGTGLYIDALVYGWNLGGTVKDEKLRAELEALAQAHGANTLHSKLMEVDPEAAARIHPNNTKRIIRALEVYKLTGKTIAEQGNAEKTLNPVTLGLNVVPRSALYDRINRRVDRMIEKKLVEEAHLLLSRGLSERSTALQAIGYKELLPYFAGKISLKEAVEEIKKNSRNYAKRQLTWFERKEDCKWFCYYDDREFEQVAKGAIDYVKSIINK